jgi:hypothetical protein
MSNDEAATWGCIRLIDITAGAFPRKGFYAKVFLAKTFA